MDNLTKVSITLSYTVPKEYVGEAKEALVADIYIAVKHREVSRLLQIEEAPDATINDVPEWVLMMIDDEEEGAEDD